MCVWGGGGGGGVVQKNKKDVKRWEAYVSVTCTWLPRCPHRSILNLTVAILRNSLVTNDMLYMVWHDATYVHVCGLW